MALIIGSPKFKAFDDNGNPLSGGKVYSYAVGTTTPAATYPTVSDAEASTNANTNPVILDSRGEADIVVFTSIKLILTDADDNQIWSFDEINTATNDVIDGNGNELLTYTAVASAVNNFNISNSSVNNDIVLRAEGDDNNIDMRLDPKGSGSINLNGPTNVVGNFDASGTGTIDGATTLGSTLDVTGNTTVTGNLTATGLTYPTTDGTENQVIKTDGDGVLTFGNNIGSVAKQIFTVSGTYTPTEGMLYADIFVLGAGGGGGGGTSTNNTAGGGAGGGAGGHAFRLCTADEVGASAAVTIGSGGAGGLSGGSTAAGSTGGNSSIALTGTGTLTITGGGGGGGNKIDSTGGTGTWTTGGGGGSATNGDARSFAGRRGASVVTMIIDGNQGQCISGEGACSNYGDGGYRVSGGQNTIAGVNASGYGSGGSGAAHNDHDGTGGWEPGGAGSNGIVIITEYING